MSVNPDSALLYAILLQGCAFYVTAMFFTKLFFGSKGNIIELKVCSVQVFWARLASFGPLGTISDPLKVSKFHNGVQDTKGQENKIYTIVKGRRCFTAAFQSQSSAFNCV